MAAPLMPKATAVWLIDNTTLTFEQVANCCQLHELEIQAIADGEVAIGIQGLDPVGGGELTKDEIERCEADPATRLKMAKPLI
ncbi:MAG: cell cycle transcriptional regulator TrcR, partial [Pseudomonadota bacterium]|nr:cell cycle transcriptional regulator TrcR [Pseudomonadota bacterium]